MPNPIDTCPIWGHRYKAEGWRYPRDGMYLVEDSPRAGGAYELTDEAKDHLDELGDAEKARLTTWLIDQRMQGINRPRVTAEVVEYTRNKKPLPVHERAERLLRYMVGQVEALDDYIDIGANGGFAACAWSESTSFREVRYLFAYLINRGWIEQYRALGVSAGNVTVEGYSYIAERAINVDSSQAFVAMWFDDEMDDAYEQGIRKGIEVAGYAPMRIDRKPDVNKIDDEIIAEIRRSRFLVADFTHGKDGARGGVYFEAGFAYGLGLDVIYSCRKDMVDQLHFDTRQYYHIVWETPEELRDSLAQRIEALIGAGPNK